MQQMLKTFMNFLIAPLIIKVHLFVIKLEVKVFVPSGTVGTYRWF